LLVEQLEIETTEKWNTILMFIFHISYPLFKKVIFLFFTSGNWNMLLTSSTNQLKLLRVPFSKTPQKFYLKLSKSLFFPVTLIFVNSQRDMI